VSVRFIYHQLRLYTELPSHIFSIRATDDEIVFNVSGNEEMRFNIVETLSEVVEASFETIVMLENDVDISHILAKVSRCWIRVSETSPEVFESKPLVQLSSTLIGKVEWVAGTTYQPSIVTEKWKISIYPSKLRSSSLFSLSTKGHLRLFITRESPFLLVT